MCVVADSPQTQTQRDLLLGCIEAACAFAALICSSETPSRSAANEYCPWIELDEGS